jgi:serine/threonine-protein kinase
LTRTGTVVGTPEYMAPEQATTGEVDARADLYAIGCVAQAMICGRPPFQNKSVLLLMAAHVTETPRKPSEVRGDLKTPDPVDAFIGKALEKDPRKRYASASEMRRALHLLARSLGSPFEAKRISMPSQRSPIGAIPASVPRASPLAQTLRPSTPAPFAVGPPPPTPGSASVEELGRTVMGPPRIAEKPPRPLPPIAPSPAHAETQLAGGQGAAPASIERTVSDPTTPNPRAEPRPQLAWLLLAAGVGATAATLIMWFLLRHH